MWFTVRIAVRVQVVLKGTGTGVIGQVTHVTGRGLWSRDLKVRLVQRLHELTDSVLRSVHLMLVVMMEKVMRLLLLLVVQEQEIVQMLILLLMESLVDGRQELMQLITSIHIQPGIRLCVHHTDQLSPLIQANH